MSEFLQIIKGTPFWVWIILAEILFVGIIHLQTRTLRLSSVFIIPVILLAVQYQKFLSSDALVWCLVIMVGSIASFLIHAYNKIKVIKNAQSIEVPGNYRTFIISLSFFIVKYYFGYLNSKDLDLFLKYSIIESVISGVFSGYFIGRALRYTYQYLKVAK